MKKEFLDALGCMCVQGDGPKVAGLISVLNYLANSTSRRGVSSWLQDPLRDLLLGARGKVRRLVRVEE